MNTNLDFGGPGETDLELSSLSFAGSLPVGDRTLVRAGGGAVLDGTLQFSGGSGHAFDSGGLAFAGLEHRTSGTAGWKPALDLALTLGLTWGRTTGSDAGHGSYRAFDLRGGLRASWTVGDLFFPYAAGRIFGGPVTWEREGQRLSGSDVHHYQLAVGAGLALGPVLVFAELAGAGETGASVGVGSNW